MTSAADKRPAFAGGIVALATPMTDAGNVDLDALDRLVDFHLEAGTAALAPAGTTGEAATLEFDEHCQVIHRVVQRAAGRAPVLAGTGANATREALALTRAARDLGADAALLIAPYYNKPTQEGLYRHYRSIAEEVALPMMIYNVPSRTACDILPETVRRLAEVEHIFGIKEASGEVARGVEIMRQCGDAFGVWSGEDSQAVELMLAGGRGVVSVTANVAPRQVRAVCEAALAGDAARAHAQDAELRDLHDALFVESNPIPVKWALHRMGLAPAGLRMPLTPLAPACHERVLAALRRAGAL